MEMRGTLCGHLTLHLQVKFDQIQGSNSFGCLTYQQRHHDIRRRGQACLLSKF